MHVKEYLKKKDRYCLAYHGLCPGVAIRLWQHRHWLREWYSGIHLSLSFDCRNPAFQTLSSGTSIFERSKLQRSKFSLIHELRAKPGDDPLVAFFQDNQVPMPELTITFQQGNDFSKERHIYLRRQPTNTFSQKEEKMSVFRVKLQNTEQGTMDRVYDGPNLVGNGATPGTQQSVSVQRQVYVMGPGRNNMLLKDGATFTGSNYWKRFAYPQVPMNQALLEVVTDDGSVYSDATGESVFAIGDTVTAAAGSAYGDNVVDIIGDYGSPATFLQVYNSHATDDVVMRVNGQATLTVFAESTQIFNTGDLTISTLEFANAGSNAVTIHIFGSVSIDGAKVTNVDGAVFPLGPGGGLV